MIIIKSQDLLSPLFPGLTAVQDLRKHKMRTENVSAIEEMITFHLKK